ncbi:hypothetical protein [Kocuria sp. U4B]
MKRLAAMAVLLTAATGTALSADATGSSAAAGTATGAGQRLPAYLQGYRQGQLLCPGGAMTGKVSVAVVDPMMATTDAPGDCTLADMKAANPDTRFFAYLDLGAMRAFEQWNGVFQNSCADMGTDHGRRFAVTPTNPEVARNDEGYATYPGFPYLSVADLSPAYAEACAATARTMLTTDAQRGTTDAPPTRFDGIFLDDVSMSPSHGQDMVDVGRWGPWADDDAYGRAVIATVTRIDAALTRSMGHDVPVAVNLGVYPAWENQVRLATELAATGAVDFALREHTVADGNGRPYTATEMAQATTAYRRITAAGMPIVEHDYSVSLREVAPAAYRQGSAVDPAAACLGDDHPDRATIVAAADTRRTLDHRMTLGHLLLTRTQATRQMTATLSQAEPHCRDNAWDDNRHWEDVTRLSVRTTDTQVTALTRAVTAGAWPTTSPVNVRGLLTVKLSTRQVLAVNTTDTSRTVTAHGKTLTVPARSATIR